MKNQKLVIGPDRVLTFENVAMVARDASMRVELSSKAKAAVRESRGIIHRMVEGKKIVYGVTTGFGHFKNKFISSDHAASLQRNLMRSHSVGVGDPLPPEMVRAAMLVRLNSLSQGHSGVRLELLDLLVDLINRNVVPVVPSQGSVGSSGDLAPLSHMGLVLMGEGEAWYKGQKMSGHKALQEAGLNPIQFSEKEGLAWNNGTSVMTGISAVVIQRAFMLADLADMAAALTVEALCGVDDAFDPLVHSIRPHPGQIDSAENIRGHLQGSRLVNSIPNRIQDAYSLRCTPQVHGAIRDALEYAARTVGREMNSVTDNPLIFSHPDRAISGGNFHGEPIAISMDTAGIALAEMADISERRIAKLLDSSTNEGLPMFLIPPEKAGLNSGLMILQYTAASLVSENKVLAHPASVDSIPTSANQEDHVSMGTIASRKAWSILKNSENVLAVEFLAAAQAIDFRDPGKLGKGTKKAYQFIRSLVPKVIQDREMASDISRIRENFPKLLKSFESEPVVWKLGSLLKK